MSGPIGDDGGPEWRTATTSEDDRRRRFTRRRALAGLGTAGGIAIAGCVGGGGSGDSGGSTDDGTGTTTDGPGEDGGDADGGSDDAGDGQSGDQTEGGMGTELSGGLASFAVEYVERVDEMVEYVGPDTGNDGLYEAPVSEQDLVEQGFVPEGSEVYAVGVAIQNDHDALLDVSTMLCTSESAQARGSLPGRSQQQWLNGGRDSSRYAVPEELQRGEVMFAFPADPAEFELVFEPFVVGSDERERLTANLGSGEEATASFSQEPQTEQYGEPVTVGDFDVTLHSIERVQQIQGTESAEMFGPRSAYDYLRIEYDVSRVAGGMENRQQWSFGAADDEGHAFWWHNLYTDALEINRRHPEDLDVDESAEGYVFGLPIETSFEPTYATLDVVGPFEDDPDRRPARMYRSLWPLE